MTNKTHNKESSHKFKLMCPHHGKKNLTSARLQWDQRMNRTVFRYTSVSVAGGAVIDCAAFLWSLEIVLKENY
jgi:hypothetical protein